MGKKIPKLTVQLLAALALVLALVMLVENLLSIRVSETLQFQFTFLPNALLGALAGPVWGTLAAVVADPIFVLMSGQSFLLGFVVIEGVSAFINGWFFYKKPLDVKEKKDWLYVTGVVLLLQIVISLGLTPLVLHVHFGTPLAVLYAPRLVKAVIEVPLRIVVLMLVLPQLQAIPEIGKLLGIRK